MVILKIYKFENHLYYIIDFKYAIMPFEYELTSRRRILLDLYQICPVIDIIKKIYKEKLKIEHNQRVNWYINIYPFHIWDNKTFMLWYNRECDIFRKIMGESWMRKRQQNHSFIFQRMIAFYKNYKNDGAIKKVY